MLFRSSRERTRYIIIIPVSLLKTPYFAGRSCELTLMAPPVLPALHAVSVGSPLAYPPVELIDGYCIGNSSCFIGTLDNNNGKWLRVPAVLLPFFNFFSVSNMQVPATGRPVGPAM